MTISDVRFGVHTFGDVTVGADGALRSQAQVIRDVVDEAVRAEEVGIDFFGIGEHHRDDFAVSSPEVVLAAIAGRTDRIRLGSAVTVLSSDDPVRVFQRFSTLDAVSGGRAEVIVGRGSFTESFPLFGFDLDDYHQLFEEKLDLFAALLRGGPISWTGDLRPPLEVDTVVPELETPLRTWVGVGGSPESVVRAARHGLPLMLAIIGGSPERFVPHTQLYRRALGELGQDTSLPIGVHLPGHIAETDDEALAELWPHFREMHARIGRDRGWAPMRHEDFLAQAGPRGALMVGSPDTVARKLAATARDLDLTRIDLKLSAGSLPHDAILRSIELYGTEVAPRVRELLAEDEPALVDA